MALFKGLRKITLLVGDNRRVEIDTELKTDSTNPVVNSAVSLAIEEIRNSIVNLSTQVNSIGETVANAVNEIQTLGVNLAATNDNLATTNYNLATTNNDIGATNNEVAEQEARINQLAEDLNAISANMATAQNELNEIEVLTENIAGLNERVATLEGYHTSGGSNEGILDDLEDLEDLFG